MHRMVVAAYLILHISAVATGGSPLVIEVPAGEVPQYVVKALPEDTKLKTGTWQLVEADQPDVVVPAQLITAIAADGTSGRQAGQLAAVIPPRKDAKGNRRFRLEPAGAGRAQHALRFKDKTDKSLGLFEGEKPVLVYNHGVITGEKVPKKDRRRQRACYVHPLYGLGGEVLTDDFPRDHYHHHGVFWTWPYVIIDGVRHDLWGDKKIKQKFVRWLARETGPVAAVLGVENGWFVGQRKVMIERVWLRVFKATENARAVDIDFTFTPVDRPIKLKGAGGKSYGGLTVRFAIRDSKKAVITVPAGVAKEDLPDTPLAWADMTTTFPGAKAPSGAAIFIPPDHPDYPPTWLTRHYGAMCVGWPGVKGKTFEPGKPFRLSYRIWIHKKVVGLDELKKTYEAYKAVCIKK